MAELGEYTTSQLVEEIKKRSGVETFHAESHQYVDITSRGLADGSFGHHKTYSHTTVLVEAV